MSFISRILFLPTIFFITFQLRTKPESAVIKPVGEVLLPRDPGNWVPAVVSISGSVTSTIADPETHAYSALVDFVTNSFNVTWAEQILMSAAPSKPHVDYTINGCWSWTLCTVKSEIPSPAAVVTAFDAKVAIPENAKPGIIWRLLENTFLWK